MLLACGVFLVFVAYTGLKSIRSGGKDWGWSAMMGYAVFGAVLIGIGLLLAFG